jgi:phosphoribosyl-dephospho-CoA transferase
MFCRHNRIWLSATGWKRACSEVPAYAGEFARCAKNDWPVVVRRNDPGVAAEHVCLGLPLPPDARSGVKVRIPFKVHADEVARHEKPLAVADAGAALPSEWREAFSDFSATADIGDMEFRVYGSAAMQAMTALPYLAASSDIDLLFYPRTGEQLHAGMRLLHIYSNHLPLDGELVFPSGRAVAWKEWAQAAATPEAMRVLAKSMQAVTLVPASELLAELE